MEISVQLFFAHRTPEDVQFSAGAVCTGTSLTHRYARFALQIATWPDQHPLPHPQMYNVGKGTALNMQFQQMVGTGDMIDNAMWYLHTS